MMLNREPERMIGKFRESDVLEVLETAKRQDRATLEILCKGRDRYGFLKRHPLHEVSCLFYFMDKMHEDGLSEDDAKKTISELLNFFNRLHAAERG